MITNKLTFSFGLIAVLLQPIWAEKVVDCRVLTSARGSCNPYTQTLIHTKEVHYTTDRQTLIVSKTLPIPEHKKMKIISVADLIEHYIEIEKPQRFHTVEDDNTYASTIHTMVVDKIEEEKKLDSMEPPVKHKTEDTTTQALGTYKVVSGDVLGKISQKFSIPVKVLLSLNKLKKSDTLHIGQEIQIPLSQKMVDTLATAEYKIEKGDTLLSIAYRFHLDPKLLVKYNHLSNATIIREGKVLSLPLPYVMKQVEKEEKRAKKELEKEELLAKKREEEKKKLAQKRKKSRIKARISKRKLYLKQKGFGRHKLRVTATAYSSHRAQTDSTPFLAAWNNRLRPGMKIIAVSRDLLSRYGLRNGTRVRIGGLRGYYRVRDKMNKRFRKRIDIYMGTNRRRALRWGRRSVNIYW